MEAESKAPCCAIENVEGFRRMPLQVNAVDSIWDPEDDEYPIHYRGWAVGDGIDYHEELYTGCAFVKAENLYYIYTALYNETTLATFLACNHRSYNGQTCR